MKINYRTFFNLKGVVEYTGSVFSGCLAANATLQDALQGIAVPTNGTFRTETLGYTYNSGTTRWVLVPGTLVALATILIVVVAVYRHVGDIPRESNQFDPSDPLQLMAAAAAGGLNNAFKGISGKEIKEGEKLDVVLGSVSGRGPALVRADEYRPVFLDAFSPRSAYDDTDD
ncbi:Protein arginine N-methyltransferase [Mycena venus]|uniref:Protein arginine N-methyltransferase n=1 Tax=Mycena venus TaxID=2733690 RepID=A0A8H7D564_9AGAR|nr:Protein arginine N-methyltransferase [Mycena venus]